MAPIPATHAFIPSPPFLFHAAVLADLVLADLVLADLVLKDGAYPKASLGSDSPYGG